MGTRIRLEIEVDDEYADPGHNTGLSDEAFTLVSDGNIDRIGEVDIDSIRRV